LWPGENPIGQRVWFGATTGPFSDPAHAVEIVGVAGNVKYEAAEPQDGIERADFYTSFLQFSYPDTMVIVKTRGAATSVLPEIRAAVASVDRTLPIYDAMTLDERIGAAVARPRFNATLLASFAGAALLLSAVGVYGMLSFSVSSGLRDIGVRVALGAAAGRILTLVLGQGLRLAALGGVIGAVASFVTARLLRGVFPDAPAWNAQLVGAASLVLLAVSAVAAIIPARRASAVDPIVVLRSE
jgi:ABC-type antimicrobial peptide transport system permease subunit